MLHVQADCPAPMARRLPGLLACLALLIAAVPPALGAPRVSSAASAGRTFAAAARSVDAGGRLIVTGGAPLAQGRMKVSHVPSGPDDASGQAWAHCCAMHRLPCMPCRTVLCSGVPD